MTTLQHREHPRVETIDERLAAIVASRSGLPCRVVGGRVAIAQVGKNGLSTQPMFTLSFDALRLVESELSDEEALLYHEEISAIAQETEVYFHDLTPADRAELLLGILEGGSEPQGGEA